MEYRRLNRNKVGVLRALVCIIAAGLPQLDHSARAQAVGEFYLGKTIDLVIGYSPGATYDLYARLVARHLGDHIPGNPRVLPRNLPGGGSRIAVNYVYKAGPQDGTVLGTADQSLPVEQAMGDKLLAIDVNRLNWIGNPVVSNNTTVAWSASGVMSIDDVKAREVSVGATGASTSSQYPRAMNALLGTKFKVVLGYPGANDINLAMERGEVAAKGSDSWAAWKATHPDWLVQKKINVLVQIGLKKDPEIGAAPLMMDLASTPADREVLKLLSVSVAIGRPLFAGPDVPPARVLELRKAFDETMRDPAFIKDAQDERLDIAPVSGLDLQTLVAGVTATPRDIADRLSGIIGAPE